MWSKHRASHARERERRNKTSSALSPWPRTPRRPTSVCEPLSWGPPAPRSVAAAPPGGGVGRRDPRRPARPPTGHRTEPGGGSARRPVRRRDAPSRIASARLSEGTRAPPLARPPWRPIPLRPPLNGAPPPGEAAAPGAERAAPENWRREHDVLLSQARTSPATCAGGGLARNAATPSGAAPLCARPPLHGSTRSASRRRGQCRLLAHAWHGPPSKLAAVSSAPCWGAVSRSWAPGRSTSGNGPDPARSARDEQHHVQARRRRSRRWSLIEVSTDA